jgi:hypothetical protein
MAQMRPDYPTEPPAVLRDKQRRWRAQQKSTRLLAALICVGLVAIIWIGVALYVLLAG